MNYTPQNKPNCAQCGVQMIWIINESVMGPEDMICFEAFLCPVCRHRKTLEIECPEEINYE